MARNGLRMMPTFPFSPLRFRTAGFPQYGSKASFPARRSPFTPLGMTTVPTGPLHRQDLHLLETPLSFAAPQDSFTAGWLGFDRTAFAAWASSASFRSHRLPPSSRARLSLHAMSRISVDDRSAGLGDVRQRARAVGAEPGAGVEPGSGSALGVGSAGCWVTRDRKFALGA